MTRQQILTNRHLGHQTAKKRYLRQRLKSSHDFHEQENFVFQSKEEVDEYLSGNLITCLECGNSYKGLGAHVYHAHGILAEDYKTKYGIPLKYGLSCPATKEKHSQVGKRVQSKVSKEEIKRRLNRKGTKCARRKTPKAFYTKNTGRKEKLIPKLVDLVCSSCGNNFQRIVKVIPKKSRCDSCKSQETKEYLKKYRQEHYNPKPIEAWNNVGENHHSSKLTKEDVLFIRKNKLTPMDAVRLYKISHTSATKVVKEKSWKSVKP